jgi:hypothetical protein
VTCPSSAPGLSQPLGGLRKRAFHGLVSCRNRSWTVFRRAFPSRGSRTPLEAACSLVVTSPKLPHGRLPQREPDGLIVLGFSLRPRSQCFRCALAGFPLRLWVPFPPPLHPGRSHGRATPFRSPWIVGAVIAPSASPALETSPSAKPLGVSPPRSLIPLASPFAPDRVAPAERPLLALVCPFRDPTLRLGASNPPAPFHGDPARARERAKALPPDPDPDTRSRPEGPSARREGPQPLGCSPSTGRDHAQKRRAADSAVTGVSDPSRRSASELALRPPRTPGRAASRRRLLLPRPLRPGSRLQ